MAVDKSVSQIAKMLVAHSHTFLYRFYTPLTNMLIFLVMVLTSLKGVLLLNVKITQNWTFFSHSFSQSFCYLKCNPHTNDVKGREILRKTIAMLGMVEKLC